MGKVFSHYVTRNARNWNVESRAMKLLEKNKLEAAPKHPSTTVKIEQFKKGLYILKVCAPVFQLLICGCC